MAKTKLSSDDVFMSMSLEEIKSCLLDDPELTNKERFELYYYEREQLKKRYKKNKKKA